MRRNLAPLVAGLVLLAGAAGCSAPGGSQPAAAAVAPRAEPSESPTDPDAPKFVAYHDFREAALQMATPADLPAAAASFRRSLQRLCRATSTGPTVVPREQPPRAPATTDPTALQPRAEETALRVGPACPRRTSDWLVVRQIGDDTPDAPEDGAQN